MAFTSNNKRNPKNDLTVFDTWFRNYAEKDLDELFTSRLSKTQKIELTNLMYRAYKRGITRGKTM